ncbi:MAG: hypothetical protein RLY86_1627 [Pseudomonadota bacterium]|jgi:MFS family permease
MTSPTAAAPAAKPPGTFAPLKHRLFAVLWAATVIGNVGTFMRDVASAWLVVDLSAAPAAVAAIQAAATLPIFLLAIPAGVLADVLDRRRLLIWLQVYLGVVSLALFALAWIGVINVWSLITLTFLGGIGAALMGPVWQSIVPELVPKSDLRGAVALNSLGLNISRAVGPAIGGLILAGAGAAAVYFVDVLTYAVVIVALIWWKREVKADGAGERFGGALRAGLRYAKGSPELHRVLFRAVCFFLFASCAWAMLPLVARDLLAGGPGFYGVLLGGVGAGAIAGALVLPVLRARLGADGLVLAGALTAAAAMAGLSLAPPQGVGLGIVLGLGVAWIAVLTTLNATAQAILPNWVRGRGLALYLTAFNGAMTAGSLAWGAVAQVLGLPATLLIAAGGLALVSLIVHRWRLPAGEADLTPSNHWPEPALAEPVEGDRGPVMITIEYRVKAADLPAFRTALTALSLARQRDGAYDWGVMQDSEMPEVVVEWFLVESWEEHLRQHRRVSTADADVQATVRAFHTGPEPPRVRHLLAF